MATSLAAIVCIFCSAISSTASDKLADGAAVSSAICPIVYPLDQIPSERGYRYMFFGNAFFVNEQGYLITAAHVLRAFRTGGQPHILVGLRGGPRRLLPAKVVAVDWEHDVAVLQATPNPFEGEYAATFLPLAAEKPPQGKAVHAVALRPSSLQDAYTFEPPMEERTAGEIFGYQFTQQDSGGRDTEVLLFSQQVLPGQSGAPVMLADSREVVGLVVGRWIRSGIPFVTTMEQLNPSPGAALRIHYAIALLRQQRISWHSVSETSDRVESAGQGTGSSSPIPLSVVAPPYPPTALFGGEVLLDALVDTSGKLADLKVVRGDAPFLEKALSAVQTWTFLPARAEGRAVEARIGIVFHFPQPYMPPLVSRVHNHEAELAKLEEHAALPAVTIEPQYPPMSIAEGSVVIYNLTDAQGRVNSMHVLNEVESLTPVTADAVGQWRFVPARQAGTEVSSAAVVVVTFRRPVLAGLGRSAGR